MTLGEKEFRPSIQERFKLHRQASETMRNASKSLGLTQVPLKDSEAANGMTALYFPQGVTAAELLPRLVKKGVVVAGGLHVDIKGMSPILTCRENYG